jgi:hypothetical protein
MKVTENTRIAMFAVFLIAVTCTILLIGGLSMNPASGNDYSRYNVASAATN